MYFSRIPFWPNQRFSVFCFLPSFCALLPFFYIFNRRQQQQQNYHYLSLSSLSAKTYNCPWKLCTSFLSLFFFGFSLSPVCVFIFFQSLYCYRAFHGFGQAKFPDGGLVLGLIQFSILPQQHQKILLDSKVVKINPKSNHLAFII